MERERRLSFELEFPWRVGPIPFPVRVAGEYAAKPVFPMTTPALMAPVHVFVNVTNNMPGAEKPSVDKNPVSVAPDTASKLALAFGGLLITAAAGLAMTLVFPRVGLWGGSAVAVAKAVAVTEENVAKLPSVNAELITPLDATSMVRTVLSPSSMLPLAVNYIVLPWTWQTPERKFINAERIYHDCLTTKRQPTYGWQWIYPVWYDHLNGCARERLALAACVAATDEVKNVIQGKK
jgi:hypothetical protein